MKNAKNFFYRVNPCEVLSEVIFAEDKEQWFLQFFSDLKNDAPEAAKTELAARIIKEAHEFRAKRSLAGQASVKQRATYVQHMLSDVATHGQQTSTSSSSRSSSSTEAVKKEKKESKPPISPLELFPICQAWKSYVEMRVAIKKPITERGKELAVMKLTELQKHGHDPVEILNQSTFHSWQGLFPVKSDGMANMANTTDPTPAISALESEKLRKLRESYARQGTA